MFTGLISIKQRRKNGKKIINQYNNYLRQQKLKWNCNFGLDGWHEVGCPHQEWTAEQLLSALLAKKSLSNRI